MRTITDYEVIDHGVEHEQYFQGCGTAFTDYEDIATGVGDDPHEALEDALESLAQADWDVEHIANTLSHESGIDHDDDAEDAPAEIWHYVSVRVK